MNYLNNILNGLGIYLVTVVIAYLIIVIPDFITYMRTGKLDHKFPINYIGTHKMCGLIALMWLPAFLLYIYKSFVDYMENDDEG